MSDASADLVRLMNASLVIVTAAADDERVGCLVGFHSQCSIEPTRYALWVSRANHTFRVAARATHLAVHLLGTGARELADLFGGTTGDSVDKFAGLEWSPGPGGAPLLAACPNRMVVRRVAAFDDGGDHVCLVGEPMLAEVGDPGLTPMRLVDVDGIEPGHRAR